MSVLPGWAAAGPAQLGVRRKSVQFMVVLRASSCVMSAVVAFAGRSSAARPDWVTACVVVLVAWGAVFVVAMLAAGPSVWLASGDVAVVLALCVLHRALVPDQVLRASAGTGWVDVVASSGVFVAQFSLRQPFGMAAAVLTAAVYAAGTPGLREAPAVLVLQGGLAATLVGLLRREARAADRELADRAAAAARVSARAAARADERDQQRRLHDTVLATLTMVGAGGINGFSPILSLRAAADLGVIEALRADAGEPAPTARLDLALRAAAGAPRPGLPPLRVAFDTPPCELPREVVGALARSVEEALTNVARHAGTDSAEIRVEQAAGVVVTVADDGRGFDPAAVPAQRRGLRESVCGRMRSVGGRAEVVTRPGGGTRVVLRWPAPRPA
ncbi:sensor histidine kinase [Actinomadura atramentaria]|uniref:sensor histidine kinase n=1 Tax=Actinomadura atramentaria TaxID=1990 RepID=UPI000372C9FB|nr:ATP-binding protein [Actinomadura atramentaria]